jgi:tetratricopeptide (TPR) repeat protein
VPAPPAAFQQTNISTGSNFDHAAILCDRAHAYIEMKDLPKALEDCTEALEYKNDYAMAYFRLGTVQFMMELYTGESMVYRDRLCYIYLVMSPVLEALTAYERSLKLDPALAEQVKVKMRQVSTAKEVQQRKEREIERERAKEEGSNYLNLLGRMWFIWHALCRKAPTRGKATARRAAQERES